MPTAQPSLGSATYPQSSSQIPAQHRVLLLLRAHLVPVSDCVFTLPYSLGAQMGQPCLNSQASHLTSLSLGPLGCKMGMTSVAHPVRYL